VESALSAYGLGPGFLRLHIRHLRGQGAPSQVLQADVLNYEAQLRSWAASEHVLVIHYNDIWANAVLLENYLGFPVQLPPRRPRAPKDVPADLNRELFDHLRRLESEMLSYSKSYRFTPFPPLREV
jgi:hypothetical protein